MEELYHKVSNFISEHDLCTKDDHILIAYSSGRDSVALAHILYKLKYKVAIAHCNFKLRNEDSFADESFAKMWSEKFLIPCHVIQFDTTMYAETHKLSIQMAARELRYNWFEDLSKQFAYTKIATAHHQDDNSETILINMLRGTGLSGLHGIPLKRDKIIRPLLSLNRKEINSYLKSEKLEYREDRTNAQQKYMRNKIRHQILPILEELNPDVMNTFFDNAQHVHNAENILRYAIQQFKDDYVSISESEIIIDTKKLITKEIPEDLLYYLLKEYEFNADQVKEILECLPDRSGRQFMNNQYRLLVDRNKILIQTNNFKNSDAFYLDKIPDACSEPLKLTFQKQPFNDIFVIDITTSVAQLDLDKLKLPLCIRKWKKGDKFHPLGMKGSKLVSDYFIDEKLNLFEKENTWILESDNKIVWIIGHRIDNRFKIEKTTKRILKISVEETNEK